MTHQMAQLAGRTKEVFSAWWHQRVDESRHCVDCDSEVSPWDEVCPGCGLLNPARVRISPLVYAGIGFGVLLVVTVLVAL